MARKEVARQTTDVVHVTREEVTRRTARVVRMVRKEVACQGARARPPRDSRRAPPVVMLTAGIRLAGGADG